MQNDDGTRQVGRRRRGRPPSAAAPTSEEILRVAGRLFAARGYRSTSVQDVVDAAGVTKPALYHHFGNKAGLYTTTAIAAIDLVVDELEQAIADATGVTAKLEATIDVGIEMMRRDHTIARLIMNLEGEISHHPELAGLSVHAARLPALFASLCEGEELPLPASDVSRMLQGIFYGSIRVGASAADAEEYQGAARALRLLIRGELASRASSAGPQPER